VFNSVIDSKLRGRDLTCLFGVSAALASATIASATEAVAETGEPLHSMHPGKFKAL
jgi:hypothetical protein